jgi:hypothetical protein
MTNFKIGDLVTIHVMSNVRCWFVAEHNIPCGICIDGPLLYSMPRIYLMPANFNGHVLEVIAIDNFYDSIVYCPALRMYTTAFEDFHFTRLNKF